MGLDFHINLIAKNKGNNQISEIPLCYWRKCYGLARTILNVISPDVVSNDEDYEFLCKTEVIPNLINVFCDIIKSYDSPELSDSIWEKEQVKIMILSELMNLVKIDSLFNFLETKPTDEELDEYIYETMALESLIDDEDLIKAFYNKDSYDFYIEIINSY